MGAGCSRKEVPATGDTANSPITTGYVHTVIEPTISAGNYVITSYGASTSSSDNTNAVNGAINAASAAGGGTVVVPSGTFLCGPITLKNNVGLQLQAGSVLKLLPYGTYPGSGGTGSVANFINLDGLTNIKISGSGTIDGQGSAWWSAYQATKATGGISRPAIIGFAGSNIIEINGIEILNAPNTNIGIGKNSNNSTLSGVTILAPATSPNTDGVDIWSGNINITNCNISCGDDNIAMDNNSEYVTITGCAFGTGHGLSIGSYASNIDHITVDNCMFNGTDNGVHMKTSRLRSGIVQYLSYSNITMINVATPITCIEYYPDSTIPNPAGSDPAQAVTATTPVWKHIILKNITAVGATKAGNLIAVPEEPMSDIVFDNVNITASTGFTANYAGAVSFTDGSRITVSTGNAFINTYSSTITGIDLKTGAPL